MEEINSDKIIVSFEDVRMKHFRAYWLAVAKGNWLEQDKFFARVVKKWSWKFDSSDPNSYGELYIGQYKQVQKAIQEASSMMLSELSNNTSAHMREGE